MSGSEMMVGSAADRIGRTFFPAAEEAGEVCDIQVESRTFYGPFAATAYPKDARPLGAAIRNLPNEIYGSACADVETTPYVLHSLQPQIGSGNQILPKARLPQQKLGVLNLNQLPLNREPSILGYVKET